MKYPGHARGEHLPLVLNLSFVTSHRSFEDLLILGVSGNFPVAHCFPLSLISQPGLGVQMKKHVPSLSPSFFSLRVWGSCLPFPVQVLCLKPLKRAWGEGACFVWGVMCAVFPGSQICSVL